MATPETFNDLNQLFAEEVEAALRYLHLAVTIKGLDRLIIRDKLIEGMQETLEHAQKIAERIVQMGGIPSLDINVHLAPEKLTAREALSSALAFEQAALDAYLEALERAKGDLVLEEFLRAQVALESEHVTEISLLLED